MNAWEVRGLLQELIDENPFAIRALLRILHVEFTSEVPTLAVTAEAQPRLKINLAFVAKHCRTPEQAKAVLCHEFLHVLLRHTSLKGPLTPARHLALDAVINAIIHRQLGVAYSSLMSEYYAKQRGLGALLRPMTDTEKYRYVMTPHGGGRKPPTWWHTWNGLYQGTVLADDLEQLAEELACPPSGRSTPIPDPGALLGNHADEAAGNGISEAIVRALEQVERGLNGGGMWRAGPGGEAYRTLVQAADRERTAWKQATLAVLRKHLQPAPGAPHVSTPVSSRLPVLSTGDRRAFLRATWSPFLPEAEWPATTARPAGRAQVYLDVSGSMDAEMPLIVALLGQLGRWIRRPFWAFSTRVAPAVIERGALRTDTTGGTSLACVLEHVADTRPASAVIVTDGYVEAIAPALLQRASERTRLHAIVTRDGNPSALHRAGLKYSQLGRLPRP